ncbi:hypothetical protein DFH11DRAFT_1615260 [Phellopilus nigrolimitatus]|nr:hypothetical protein DFH11DRAFT_1615260 [Phellopilus nigrolimitatus]
MYFGNRRFALLAAVVGQRLILPCLLPRIFRLGCRRSNLSITRIFCFTLFLAQFVPTFSSLAGSFDRRCDARVSGQRRTRRKRPRSGR